jgi:type II secretory pathway component PulK
MKKQEGSAIIAAIFIALLVALIATGIAFYTRHLMNPLIAQKAFERVQYLLDFPIPIIQNKIDGQTFFRQGFNLTTKKDGITISSFVETPQALLNINQFAHLSRKDQNQAIQNMSHFLALIGVKQNPLQVANILISALNYSLKPTGEELGIYEWPGHPLIQPSSLRSIPGITAETYRLLRDWITVLPTSASTISDDRHWPVLVAYGLSIDNAKKLAHCLQINPGMAIFSAITACHLSTNIAESNAMGEIASEDSLMYFETYSYFFENGQEHQKRILFYREKKSPVNRWYPVWQHSDINE